MLLDKTSFVAAKLVQNDIVMLASHCLSGFGLMFVERGNLGVGKSVQNFRENGCSDLALASQDSMLDRNFWNLLGDFG